MTKLTKILIIGFIFILITGYMLYKYKAKKETTSAKENFQNTGIQEEKCQYTTTDSNNDEIKVPKCTSSNLDIYDMNWSFPKNFAPTLKPEWDHYISCERKGFDFVSKYQQSFLGNVYTNIIQGLGISKSYTPGDNPPWDYELNSYNKIDVCWGDVKIEASENIFTKAFLRLQAENAKYLPKVKDSKTNFSMEQLAIPQSAWTVEQQQAFQDYQSDRSSSEQFATQCGAALIDTAVSLAIPLLTQKAAKTVGNQIGKRLKAYAAKNPSGRIGRAVAASSKRAANIAANKAAKNAARFSAITKAISQRFGPGAAKDIAKTAFSKGVSRTANILLKTAGVGAAKNFLIAATVLGPVAPLAAAFVVIGQCVALLAVTLIGTSYLQKKCGDHGCCKRGDNAWTDMLPPGVLDFIVNNFASLLPGLDVIMTVFGVVEPFGCTHFGWDFFGGMMGGIVTTCTIGQYLPVIDPISASIKTIAKTTCFILQGSFLSACLAPIGVFYLKETPVYPNFMYIPHTTLCFRDWYKEFPAGTENYDCTKNIFPKQPICSSGLGPCNFGADGFAAASVLKYAYVNGKNPRFLDMAAQFYYDQSFAHPQIPIDGFNMYEYITEFVAIVASSEYSFDCVVNIKEVTFNSDTGVICCERMKYNRDRRFYISYASYGQLNKNNVGSNSIYWNGDYDWDFYITGCTYVDGTAPELYNFSDTSQYQWDLATEWNIPANRVLSMYMGYDSVAGYAYNNRPILEISGNSYIEITLQDDLGNSTPITLNRVSFDFSYSGVPWVGGKPRPYICSNVTFCRTGTLTYVQCSSFDTVSSFIDDYHTTYPNRHIKEIRNMEPQIKITSAMNQAGGNDVPGGDVCEYDLAYVSYDSNTNTEGSSQTLHSDVYYKFHIPQSNSLSCKFIQYSNVKNRLYGDMQPIVSNYYGSIHEYSNGYLRVSHGPIDEITSNHTPLRGYPYIDPIMIADDGAKCGPLGFTPPRPLPAETVLGDGQCASNDSNICKNPEILAAFMNDVNGNNITTYTSSNSKCYINDAGIWYRDSNDTKILSIGKVVTPAVPNSSGASPRFNRCDVEFDIMSNVGTNSTIYRTNTHFYVSNVGPAANCSFAYKTGSYGPFGSGGFIQYNTPNLTDLIKFTDASGISVKYKPINYVGGFLQTLVEKYNKFILFITGNEGGTQNSNRSMSNDPLAMMLSNTEQLLSEADKMMSNFYTNMSFKDCPKPSSGYQVCQDPRILSEMQKVYNMGNYPTQQFGVTKKFMDEIFRVAVSETGSNGPAACDAVFSTWAVKYNDLFGLPVGNPTRKLEGARFYFTQTSPGTCSYNASNVIGSLLDENGSIALRVAASNLPIPWPALNTPICSVSCADPKIMTNVAKFVNRNEGIYIQKFYSAFQATPMTCQYTISDDPALTSYNRVIELTFEYDTTTSNCNPILTSDSFQEFDLNDMMYNPNLSNGVYTKVSDPTYIYNFPGILVYGDNNMPLQSNIFMNNLNYVPIIS